MQAQMFSATWEVLGDRSLKSTTAATGDRLLDKYLAGAAGANGSLPDLPAKSALRWKMVEPTVFV